MKGLGDIAPPEPLEIRSNLRILPGDLSLSRFEDKLSDAWPRCQNSDEASFRAMTAFHRMLKAGAAGWAELVLIDVGPNLGAINRSALLSSDHVCVPLAPDLYSIQGLRNLGPALREWRAAWAGMKGKSPHGLSIPAGSMTPEGYVVMQHGMRDNRPVRAYERWMKKIPGEYRRSILGDEAAGGDPDPNCLAQLKHYRSLMPLSMEAHKPMFHLTPADGAIGAHVEAVRSCRDDFKRLALAIAERVGIGVPT